MFKILMSWMRSKRILPQISSTEWQALKAGTTWIDGEFFSGKPDFRKILSEGYHRLSDEERRYIDGPVEKLLHMIDPYEIGRTKRIPDDVLNFIKSSGMMGLAIPREFGGKQFSIVCISTIMSKVNNYCATVGTFVVIPNSLGAAELILHFGTEAQRRHYLPRLAAGDYLSCFALTEPTAGSDAASMKAEGQVFRQTDGSVGIRLNFRKRYITLAPIANLATIACRLHDPQNLLGKGKTPGITCLLVHKETPGFVSGDHHEPMGDPFYNGPLEGTDLIVTADSIIGGAEKAGDGWEMLMELLAGGRMVSLPAGAAGNAKSVAAFTGAYSMIREQFGLPIGLMEGVEERVARIAGLSYLVEGSRIFTCSAVDRGHAPPVISAVMKAYSTEIGRQLLTDGMDVFAGAGVMQGPRNILGRGYMSTPVGVTVEGANILTRTFVIFGQGATRCHPYALQLIKAVEGADVAAFRGSLTRWIKHFLFGLGRTTVLYLTRGYAARCPVRGPTATYYRRLAWSAARFAVLTDLALLTLGRRLKQRGKLTGRFADVLAWMVLATGALRRFEADGRLSEDLPLVQYASEYALAKIHEAFGGIYTNFGGVLGLYLKTAGNLALRINPLGSGPSDFLSGKAARTIQFNSAQYQRLTQDVFIPSGRGGRSCLMRAFELTCAAESPLRTIREAQKKGQLSKGSLTIAIQEAVSSGLVNAEDGDLIARADQARLDAIEVDTFRPEQYFGNINSCKECESGSDSGRLAVNS